MPWKTPPRNWKRLGEWFEFEGGQFFNKRISLYGTMRKAGEVFQSAAEIEVELRQAEFVFADPIARYIDEIIARFDEWPDLSAYPVGALHLIGLRVDTLLSWTWHHDAKRNLLNYPTVLFPELARWLLVDWWQARGRGLGAERLVIDHVERLRREREFDGEDEPGRRAPRKTLRAAAAIDLPGARLAQIPPPLSAASASESEKRGREAECEAVPPPHSWETLADWLTAQLSAFHAFPSLYEIVHDTGDPFTFLDEVADTIKWLESHHKGTLGRALRKWAREGTWPQRPIPATLGALIAGRIETAARWVQTHAVNANHDLGQGTRANPFIYPAVSQEELVGWLLTDWWAPEGRYLAVEQLQIMHVQASRSI